jgi:hypothetical protein
MNMLFYSSALSMTFAALACAAAPLVRARVARDSGFAHLPLLGVIAALLLAIGLYAVIGRPDVKTYLPPDEQAQVSTESAGAKQDKAGTVGSLLSGLESRLQSEPDDGKGWLLLAKSYDHLGRKNDAADAYAKAKALGFSDDGLESRIQDGSSSTDDVSGIIRGRVSLADSAADSVTGTDVVFVIATATNGDRMPLAVVRRSASDLPFEFELNDENSMVKDRGVSTVGQLTVVAKISRTGDALNTVTELGAASELTDAGANRFLDLVIE